MGSSSKILTSWRHGKARHFTHHARQSFQLCYHNQSAGASRNLLGEASTNERQYPSADLMKLPMKQMAPSLQYHEVENESLNAEERRREIIMVMHKMIINWDSEQAIFRTFQKILADSSFKSLTVEAVQHEATQGYRQTPSSCGIWHLCRIVL